MYLDKQHKGFVGLKLLTKMCFFLMTDTWGKRPIECFGATQKDLMSFVCPQKSSARLRSVSGPLVPLWTIVRIEPKTF